MREYVWLTSAVTLGNQIPAFFSLVSSTGPHCYAYDLRHGDRIFRGSGEYPLDFPKLHYEAERRSDCFRYYLAGVGPEGSSLDLTNVVFLLSGTGPSFVVGSNVWRRLELTCDLTDMLAMDIAPNRVRAHAWRYAVPFSEDDAFSEHIAQALGVDEYWVVENEPEWLPKLCKRYPYKGSVDGLKAIYPPFIDLGSILGVRWVRSKGYLEMTLRRDATICMDISGSKVIGPEYFEGGGVLQNCGLIAPKSIGDFDDLDEKFEWPRVASKFDLRIEWE